MFSDSCNDRRPRGRRSPQGSAIIPQKSSMAPQVHRDRRYHHERDPMLNSVLNGDWSNSVPGRKIPEGMTCSYPVLAETVFTVKFELPALINLF